LEHAMKLHVLYKLYSIIFISGDNDNLRLYYACWR